MDLTTLVSGVMAGLGVGLVFWFFAMRQVAADSGQKEEDQPAPQEPKPSLPMRERLSAALGQGARPLLRGQRGSKLQAKLTGAGLSVKPHEFVVVQLACVALLDAAGWLRFNTILVAGAAAFGGYFLPSIWVRRKDLKRRRRIDSQLADMIGM